MPARSRFLRLGKRPGRHCGAPPPDLHRRNLDESQRAMVAARIATLNAHRPTGSASKEAPTQSEAAELLNVSRPSVQRARVVQRAGIPELLSAVDAGDVAVTAAVCPAPPRYLPREGWVYGAASPDVQFSIHVYDCERFRFPESRRRRRGAQSNGKPARVLVGGQVNAYTTRATALPSVRRQTASASPEAVCECPPPRTGNMGR